MKTKMGFRNKFAYSFYDFSAYKEFIGQGLGKAIFYTFIVTLIFSTITNIKIATAFNSAISKIEDTFDKSAPNFELSNGILSVDYSEPIFYKHGDFMLIVDTSGKTTNSALNPYCDGIYINSNALTARQNYTTVQNIDLAEFSGWIITNANVKNILSIMQVIFPIMLFILNPIISFLTNLVSAFAILAPFTLSIGTLMGVKLKYSKACTLSFYAMTLPLLLEALLEIAGINVPEFYIVFYMISLLYCGLAIREIKNIDKSNLNYM
ncbi:DUF1189 domain-containing protein [Clostridium chromiireducens]|uniref:DUF1189 domain-containing protein n=1 Tax=Clostridium chromiireducens TaxID=225345 RepID=A0A1V4ICW2_9CLOT|nr:DUF1189 domain-containing protein [Clostridium chromiireducens]MVX65860.1 DUF1189 domain-containing protein [Clostridium chromiireducens]OPJ57475.1 hypothetical protein CLCHR_44120 [Clostridium chromiireducens]RII34432.1 DUF1189 domain-containing protein [Clostridium chromiireducens]